MAEVLELAQLLQHDGVPQVQVRRGRVQAELHAQRTPLAGAAEALASSPAGSASTALRVRNAASSAGEAIGRNGSLGVPVDRLPPPSVHQHPGRRRHAAAPARRISPP